MICERCGQYFKRRGVETVCSFTCYKKRKDGIKSDFVQVERRDLEELKRKSQWTPASKENEMFDACFIFCEKYLSKGG